MHFRNLFTLLLLVAAPAVAQQPEIETKEAPATFTSRVNLVPVTVVVRDRDGHAVGNLTKGDFRLLDNGKPQVIARFSIEKPSAPAVVEKEAGDLEPPAAGAAAPPVLADHFVAYLFDDLHITFEDMVRTRDAATRVIAASMQPADRAAIFTTSGHIMLEFTNDQAKLRETLARLRPAPINGGLGHGLDCRDMSYFLADQIVNLNNTQAFQAAMAQYQACTKAINATVTGAEIFSIAQFALTQGEQETRQATNILLQVVRRISGMPGQRSIVLASPGFFVPYGGQQDLTEVINRAIRENVVVSTLDVRGVWMPPAIGATSSFDAANPRPRGGGMAITYLQEEAEAGDPVMEDLAHATGGEWFHGNNNVGEGFRRLAAAPEFIYVLAFTPENLASDGKYHKLQIALRDPKGLTLQARKGYYAPKRGASPVDQAKQEIEDEVFSRDVVRDIPLAVHTQFFRSGDAGATLSVVSQLDIRFLHYRKAEGRNHDTVTIVAAVFDRSGNYIAADEKLLTLKLRDETLENKLGPGVKVKCSLNVKAGSYVVRVVARESEGRMLATETTAVDIP
jgi:VWFA-related protein